MTDEMVHIIQNCKVGEEQKLRLSTVEQNRDASLMLVRQARHTLDIVCRDFDHALYDNNEFYDAVKLLATSSPKAKIRILIQDSSKAVKQGHRIVELARRLTSFINIRIQEHQFKEFNEAWLIVDSRAWIRRTFADKYQAELDCSAARVLKEIGNVFTGMWNQAKHDPNLRRLSL